MPRNEKQLEGLTLLGNKGVNYEFSYKSLKLYLFSFRNRGDFHEDCVNIIMKDLIKLLDPKYIEVVGDFNPRGGISIYPYVNYGDAEHQWLVSERMKAVMAKRI